MKNSQKPVNTTSFGDTDNEIKDVRSITSTSQTREITTLYMYHLVMMITRNTALYCQQI